MRFNFNYKPYIAIIGDIKNSKNLINRHDVQLQLNDVLDEISCCFESELASRFMITLGDEFQGLLCSGKYTLDIISYIERKMYPVNIRFGIGVGSITTDINPDMPLGADGPAYYYAREMITTLKKAEKKNMESLSNIKIYIDCQHEISELINSILALGTAVQSKWTDRQREVIYDYLEYRDSQCDMAHRLGITQSNVNKNLSASNFYTYKNSMDAVSRVLCEIQEDDNV